MDRSVMTSPDNLLLTSSNLTHTYKTNLGTDSSYLFVVTRRVYLSCQLTVHRVSQILLSSPPRPFHCFDSLRVYVTQAKELDGSTLAFSFVFMPKSGL